MESNLIAFLLFLGACTILSYAAAKPSYEYEADRDSVTNEINQGHRVKRAWAPWTYAGSAGRPGRFGSSGSSYQTSRVVVSKKHRQRHHRKHGRRYGGLGGWYPPQYYPNYMSGWPSFYFWG